MSTPLFAGIEGERRAELDNLLPVVYDDLRKRARGLLRSDRCGELQPTLLVHEAYARLAQGDAQWGGGTHFCALAALAIRQVLVDHLRRAGRAKRGGDAVVVT